MMKAPFIFLPRNRYKPPHGTILWLPLRDMSVGVSPNLLSNGGFESGATVTGSARVTNASEAVIFYSGAKSLKSVVNDAGGAGIAASWLDPPNPTYYRGLTFTVSGQVRCASTNDKNQLLGAVSTGGATKSATVAKDDAFHLTTVSRKMAATDNVLEAYLYGKDAAAADTDDVVYFDDISLTVPQTLSRDAYSRICHPEGMSNFQFSVASPPFDGIDNLITFESDFIGTSACTIMGWVYLTSWPAHGTPYILTNGKVYLIIQQANARLYWTSDNVTVAVGASSSINLNTWYHVAVTRDASGVSNCYLNGVINGAPDQAGGTPTAGTTNVVVGNRLAGDKAFAGTIDDLLVFNRVLAKTEIVQHYLATKAAH